MGGINQGHSPVPNGWFSSIWRHRTNWYGEFMGNAMGFGLDYGFKQPLMGNFHGISAFSPIFSRETQNRKHQPSPSWHVSFGLDIPEMSKELEHWWFLSLNGHQLGNTKASQKIRVVASWCISAVAENLISTFTCERASATCRNSQFGFQDGCLMALVVRSILSSSPFLGCL